MKYSWLFLAALTLAGCRTPYMAYDCEPTGAPWPFPGWNCKGGYSELELATEASGSAQSRIDTILDSKCLIVEQVERFKRHLHVDMSIESEVLRQPHVDRPE